MQGLLAPFVLCLDCNNFLNFSTSNILDFIQKKTMKCESCQNDINWFETVKNGIFDNFMKNAALGFIGCKSSILNFTMEPNTTFELNFENYGIPQNAEILYINYTPQDGNLFPVEMHGNTSTLRFKKNKVLIYPIPSFEPEAKSTIVNVLVSWFLPSDFDDAFINLFEAFEEYIHGNYLGVIIPANVAIETTIYRLMNEFLKEFSSNKKVEEFLTNNATYGYQLSILLPMFLSFKGMEEISDQIIGNLNRLRKLRNEYAHNGKIKKIPSHIEIAEILTSCLFVFHYIKYLHQINYKYS
ncbi:hypothetical protein [Acinetobacter baumannii]